MENGEMFKLGDNVRVNYFHQNNFPRLQSMCLELHDMCQNCYCFYEAGDAQRIECPERCSTLTEIKERINKTLKLVSKTTRDFRYSAARCLIFTDDNTGKSYSCTIYENHPLFFKTGDLEIINMYTVVGWTSNDKYNSLDVIDIY